ncbi:MAG: GPO family capsid scaffolding protein [Candidatus Methanoperedens sp.]|nr:GPO family capsid scaffolding protein [Candidatus Methanoperedens sp.]
MPIEYVKDQDKIYFEICRKAYPFIIHTSDSPTFQAELIKLMAAIDISNTKRASDLYELATRAETLIDDYLEKHHEAELNQRVTSYYNRAKTLDEQFAEIHRLAKGKRSNADKELSELKAKVYQLSASTELSELKARVEQLSADVLRLSEKHLEVVPEVVPGVIETEVPLEVPKEAEKIKLRKKRSSPNEIEQELELLKNYLKTNGEIDNSKCREICNVNMTQARHLLHKLIKDNFIEQIGSRHLTKYSLKK